MTLLVRDTNVQRGVLHVHGTEPYTDTVVEDEMDVWKSSGPTHC